MSTRLDGKVAIVTGGGRGSVRPPRQRLAAEGAAVVINDIDAEPAEQTAAAILADGGQALAHVANTVDAAAPRDSWRGSGSVRRCGHPHQQRRNHAGQDVPRHGRRHVRLRPGRQPQDRDQLHPRRHAGDARRREGGDRRAWPPTHNRKIVFTSSVAALMGNPGQVNYVAAKGSLIAHDQDPGPRAGAVRHQRQRRRAWLRGDEASRRPSARESYGIPDQMRGWPRPSSRWAAGPAEDIAAVHAFLASPDSGLRVRGDDPRHRRPARRHVAAAAMTINPDYIGKAYPTSAPYLVGREKVREFATAIGDFSPASHDVGAARALGYPDLVAPPVRLRAEHPGDGAGRVRPAGRPGLRASGARRAVLRVQPGAGGGDEVVVDAASGHRQHRAQRVHDRARRHLSVAGEPICTTRSVLVVRGTGQRHERRRGRGRRGGQGDLPGRAHPTW